MKQIKHRARKCITTFNKNYKKVIIIIDNFKLVENYFDEYKDLHEENKK